MVSKLLFNTRPLVIDPDLACLIGLNESIVLQQVHYWTEINRKSDRNFKDGYHWTYNSYEDWQKQFPFWSIRTIKRIITNLESSGLIVSETFNKIPWDRTKWYRIDYETLQTQNLRPLGQIGTMDSDKMTQPIPETNQKGILLDDSRLLTRLWNKH